MLSKISSEQWRKSSRPWRQSISKRWISKISKSSRSKKGWKQWRTWTWACRRSMPSRKRRQTHLIMLQRSAKKSTKLIRDSFRFWETSMPSMQQLCWTNQDILANQMRIIINWPGHQHSKCQLKSWGCTKMWLKGTIWMTPSIPCSNSNFSMYRRKEVLNNLMMQRINSMQLWSIIWGARLLYHKVTATKPS